MSEFYKHLGVGQEPSVFQAPGRINIIGEHVDYLGGLVLPAAINYSIQASIRPNSKGSYRLYSLDYNSYWETNAVCKSDRVEWVNYVMGIIDGLESRGFSVPGFDLLLQGNIPQGSGLSSSAALEVVLGYGLNEVFSFGLTRTEIALLGQKAENEFVGTKCGIMDQFVIAHGKKDHCISLNTSDLSFEYHKFDLLDHEFFLIQSNVKHSLNTSEYNTRRTETNSALNKIQAYRQDHGLTDINNLYELDWNTDIRSFGLEDKEASRVRHVLSEKERTHRVIQALGEGDMQEVGSALTECHWSLARDYEVSCPETDFLVDYLTNQNVSGSRMIGGGFGGCVLVLDRKDHWKEYFSDLSREYKKQFDKLPDRIAFELSNGVSKIE